MKPVDYLEKIASGEEEVDSLEKLATYYDSVGRQLAHDLVKEARKLPPGAFSGKAGLMKLLGGAAAGGTGFAIGSGRAKKEGQKDDVAIAQRAYTAGVRRGAQAVMAKLRGMQ